MGLDVRLPLGFMFATMGLLLIGYGVLAAGVAGASMNVKWGFVLLAVGAVTLWLAMRGAKARRTG